MSRFLGEHKYNPMKQQNPSNTVTDDSILHTSAEACAFLKISRPTLHRYVRDSRLLPKRLPGGGLRFLKSDLEKLLA